MTRATAQPEIGDVLAHYGAGHIPTGTGWKPLRCPFHDDTHPSASINHATGRFRCFTCDLYEDSLGIIQWREGVPFAAAQRYAETHFTVTGDRISNKNEEQSSLGLHYRKRDQPGRYRNKPTRIRYQP